MIGDDDKRLVAPEQSYVDHQGEGEIMGHDLHPNFLPKDDQGAFGKEQ